MSREQSQRVGLQVGFEVVEGRPANTNRILTTEERYRLPVKYSFVIRGPGGRVLVNHRMLQEQNAVAWFDTPEQAMHVARSMVNFVKEQLRRLQALGKQARVETADLRPGPARPKPRGRIIPCR